MPILTRTDILARLQGDGPARLWIDPLLSDDQVGEVTLDLRLGYDFLVPILTRKPFIGLIATDPDFRSTSSYYQATRREIGDRFIIYPGQAVLTTTLEYIGLPADVYADVLPRSSYLRLGLYLNSMIQPGYRGCFPIELTNGSNNPIELIVGSRIMQSRLLLTNPTEYNRPSEPRKYLGNTRPTVSRAADDGDLARLSAIANQRYGQ
jgi:dCTP deaminase